MMKSEKFWETMRREASEKTISRRGWRASAVARETKLRLFSACGRVPVSDWSIDRLTHFPPTDKPITVGKYHLGKCYRYIADRSLVRITNNLLVMSNNLHYTICMYVHMYYTYLIHEIEY